MDIALGAIGRVPIVGKIAAFAINLGNFIAAIVRDDVPDAPLMVPWTNYSEKVDEGLVRDDIIKIRGGATQWTDMFLAPLKGEWRYEKGIDETGREIEGGKVFAALDGNNAVGYTGGFGAIPGSMRVAGVVQTRAGIQACGGGQCPIPTNTRRYVWVGKNRTDMVPFPPHVIDTGAFFPSFAVIAAQLAECVMKAGSPDQFKVRAGIVKDSWREYFQSFFAGGFAAAKKDPWIWAAMAPYVCQVLGNGSGKIVRLGIQNLDRPHLGPFVWPGMFEQGPGEPTMRANPAFFVDAKGFQHEDPKLMVELEGGPGPAMFNRIARRVDTNSVSPSQLAGLTAISWPTGSELLSEWRRPDVAITDPWCDRLAARQRHSLEATLVCAYVRPDPVGDLPRYEAFEDEPLRTKCRELREVLLKHPARFNVDLDTVDAVDPKFATRLRAAGVTGRPLDLDLDLGKGSAPVPPPNEATLVPSPAEDPPDEDPADGLGFDELSFPTTAPTPETTSKLPWIIAGLAGAAAAAGAVALASRPSPRRTFHRISRR